MYTSHPCTFHPLSVQPYTFTHWHFTRRLFTPPPHTPSSPADFSPTAFSPTDFPPVYFSPTDVSPIGFSHTLFTHILFTHELCTCRLCIHVLFTYRLFTYRLFTYRLVDAKAKNKFANPRVGEVTKPCKQRCFEAFPLTPLNYTPGRRATQNPANSEVSTIAKQEISGKCSVFDWSTSKNPSVSMFFAKSRDIGKQKKTCKKQCFGHIWASALTPQKCGPEGVDEPHRHPIATWYMTVRSKTIFTTYLTIVIAICDGLPPGPPKLASLASITSARPTGWLSLITGLNYNIPPPPKQNHLLSSCLRPFHYLRTTHRKHTFKESRR